MLLFFLKNRRFSVLNGSILLTLFFLHIVATSCKKPAEQTIVALAKEHRKTELPDGSQVIVNAASSLGWSPGSWEQDRSVELKGEAYFQTKRRKRFIIRAEEGQVEVVDAYVNVYARDGAMEVQCTKGKAQVSNSEGTQKVLLKKGEEVSVVDGWMQDRRRLRFYPVWFKGESAFRDVPLQRVLDEVERQYGVLVLADSISEKTFSGKFGHKDLEKALVAVCRPMNMTYAIRGDTVHIAKK